MIKPRVLALSATILCGCAAGPDFKPPPPPATANYTVTPQPQRTVGSPGSGGSAQQFVDGAAVPAEWWRMFGCEALNRLVEQALTQSPTLLEARARLREAQEDFTARTGGALYPSVDAGLGVAREQVDPAVFGFPNVPNPPPFTLYNVQVNVSYTLDLFGATRRGIESERERTEYQAYETEAAQLTLAANVVTAVVRQAALAVEINRTGEIIAAQGKSLAIDEERYRTGGLSQQGLADERRQYHALRASLPALLAQRAQIDHQLAVYTGKPPSQAAIPALTLTDLKLPSELPLTLPSELVRRRPDVRASEALWHEASANVGLATANLLPRLTLTGSAASDRFQASDLVNGFNVWNVGAQLMQPIFRGGELRAQRRSAVAAYDEAAQAYEQTVLQAMQQVADTLRALESDALTLEARNAAASQADASYAIAGQRHALGGVSDLALLSAQREALQAQIDRSRAEASRYADTAALLQALGGGW